MRYPNFGISFEDVIFLGKDKNARVIWKHRSLEPLGDCFYDHLGVRDQRGTLNVNLTQ